MFAYCNASGEERVAQQLAERYTSLANRKGEPSRVAVGERLIGLAMHYGGNQSTARYHIERSMRLHDPRSDRLRPFRLLNDERVQAQVLFGRVLWLQGSVDQAKHNAQESLKHACAIQHQASICYALGAALCPITLAIGDLDDAERSIAMLIDASTKYNSTFWMNLGPGLQGALLCRRDAVAGTRLLSAAYDTFRKIGLLLHFSGYLADLAGGLAAIGRLADGLIILDEALDQARRDGLMWHIPELLRVKGELLLQDAGDPSDAAIDGCFQEALAIAKSQDALFWELRAATSFARLRRDQGRPADATALLQPVYDRFTEGFETADLRSARALLDTLR